MRKVSDVSTPKRGRPPKKQLIAPKSAPAATGEASPVPQNGAKSSNVPVSKQANSSGSRRQNPSINKRNGNRSTSVDSSGIIRKKRRLKSPEKAALPSEKTSTPSSSRASSKEKVETLFSKTVKQEALKVAQSLESTVKRISRRGKLQGVISTQSQKKKTQAIRKKSKRCEPIKELKNDPHKTEIKRLSTTDGFWSSKTPSRSNSPLGQPLEQSSQKQTHAVKKDSRTSTPDISPSSTKRQPITKIRSDKEEVITPKPNNPVSELRRLRTTEGFSFRDSAVGTSITDSRDASPSSVPSLERAIRQNTRPLSRSNEQKNVAKNCDVDQNVVVNDIPQGKLKMKNKKVFNDVNDKLSELRMDTSETVSQNSSTLCSEQTGIECPVSRLQNKKRNSSEQLTKQDKQSLHARNRKASFIRGFNKRQRLKITSVLPFCGSGESSIDQTIPTSISVPEVQGKVRQTRRSGIKRVIKNSPKKGRGSLKRVKHKLNVDSLELLKSSGDASSEDLTTPEAVGELLLSDVDCSVKATSLPEFAISDLLDSAELKRLNTTAGFWASMPDISTVLGKSYHRRLRDTDSSSTRASSDQLTAKKSEQLKELPKIKKSPVKSQSTLLQHRKKRLQALQNSLRKIKQQISVDEVADQNKIFDTISQTAIAACEQKPDPVKRISTKKRGYKTRSKFIKNDQGSIFEVMNEPEKQHESVEAQGDIKVSSLPLDLNMDAIEPPEQVKSELRNKKLHDLSGAEVSTSVTDSLSAKIVFGKTWKRGRRKVVPGAANLSSIKTRGRGKADSCTKSLDVLQNLEPNREDKLFSASHDTPKVGKEKKKLKRPKKKALPESDLNGPNIDIDKLSPQGTDDLQTIDMEDKAIGTNQQSSLIIASVKTDNEHVENLAVLSRQNSGHKKDNLFESLAFDLLMPSDVPSINVSTDVSVASPLNANVEPLVVIKSDVVMVTDNCDQASHDVSDLEIIALTDSEFNETNTDHSGQLGATDIKEVIVNKESMKDIPVKMNSSASHSLSPVAVVPMKLQSLDESLVVENEQNFAAFETKNDIAVVNEIASECDSLTSQVKEIIPTETIAISKIDESPLGQPDTVDVLSHLAEKSNIEISSADCPESSILDEDNSEDVRDISEKEQVIKSVESSLNHHINVESESVICAEVIEHDLAVENTSHYNISTINDICNPTKCFNQHEHLQNVISGNDCSLKRGEEKRETFSEEIFVFKCVDQNEILNSDSEIVSDKLSVVPMSADLHSSEGKVEENIVVDISVAPRGLLQDGDISPLHTAQLPEETVGLKRRKKKKKQTPRFINSILNADIAPHSAVENQMPVYTCENTEVRAEAYAGENLIVTTTLPANEQLKRQKKRRRNAWKRGVLRKASNLSRKNSKQRQLLNFEKCPTPAPVSASMIEGGASIASSGAQVEIKGHQERESYSPAIKKSLSNMLKKLETNANLANAVLVEKPYKGRFLRNVQPQQQKGKQLKGKRKKFNSVSSTQPNLDTVQSLPGDTIETFQIEIPKDLNVSGTIKRKRGRPKKHRDGSSSRLESFPRLTPLHNLPTLRPVTPWNTTPPNLSPQAIASQGSAFFDMGELKNAPDPDFVCESVDDTDLHLYLSGVSDEELSPKKELHPVSDMDNRADTPVSQERKCGISRLETIKENSLNVEDTSAAQEAVQVCGPELKEIVKPKFKGRKGRPPGIPMTEEEKRQKVQKIMLSQELHDEQDLVESLGTSQKLAITPEVCGPPVFIGKIITPAAKFSLRKKSTRSPLEMLAMKRKQEEARYDLEQEKRQARLIHLREMRSARESGDGFSDDGDGGLCPENLSLCSVVLSDFVKKLQLDDIEASSCEEPSHQLAENLSANEESPDYNGDEEDWCADLEESTNGDRNDSRPYIPRLKLKRVIKKGISSQSKRVALRKQQLDERHEPIKLVIKTEPSSEQSEQVGVKSSIFVESSRLDRPSCENSFMEYLRGKNESEKIETPKRRYNISRYTNIETSKLNVTDLSSAEILTLPMPGVRDSSIRIGQSLIIDTDKTASIDDHQSVNIVAPIPRLLREGTTITHADKLSRLENVEASKRLSSGDEEEDDILILDLDDGAGDQNSEETFRDNLPQLSGCLSVIPGRSSPPRDNEIIVSKENDTSFLIYPTREDRSDGNEMRRSTFRSFSNDEMGLMFESYNSEEDKSADNLSHAEKNVTIISASSESNTGAHIQEISHSVTSILMDSNSVQRNNVKNVQQPQTVADISDNSFLSSETTTKDTSNALCGGSAIDTLNTDNLDEKQPIRQHEITSKDKEQRLVEIVSGNIQDDTLEDTSNLPHSESLTTTSEKTVVDGSPDIATLDNNNVTHAFKHVPKVSVPVKKPGIVSDSSKSPKHSTYYDSGPEEWKVKVILHSDKFPSGKYSCKRCGFATPSKLTIESHIYSHIPGVQFRCAYCESEFSSMAATSSHLKNTHSLNEAKLHISRHIDEKNFYDKETAIYSEESGQHSTSQGTCANTASGGQSPPVIISVVVSGGVASSRSGRPTAPPRRFVCTHCGFSTNVKEDAEHHVLDLHASQSLFACLLCSENVCYTEREIKDHSATVHPARHLPYRKLPDFYDAEQLNLKDKAALQDDRENIFERMTSMFQDDSQTGTNAIDHRQKAKEYLFLQEGWREKTRVEADSTTAVDYTEESSAPQTPTPEFSVDEGTHQADATENEVSDHDRTASKASDTAKGLCKTAALSDDASITSSARSAITISSVNSQVVNSGVPSEPPGQQTVENNEETLSRQPDELACQSHLEADDQNEEMCEVSHQSLDDNDDDSEDMGLKIIQVVSLSGQEEDIVDEQISKEQPQPEEADTGIPTESDNCQTVASPSEGTIAMPAEAHELLATKHSSSTEEAVTKKDIQAQTTVDLLKSSSQSDVTAESCAAGISTASSSAANPSFAGGLPLSYKCNACKVHTPYLLMMVKHLKARHPNMRCFSCPYCKTTHSFVSQKQLRHHVKQSHPNKFGRNEIALSDDAKKFVEAMVLPIGPECIRVGSRIVLEEDIHTCTYCQVKMISLANVYEHLNTKHSDLFEFVCPVCQSFKNKKLTEISEHCLKTHKSSLDTDKVHVSVPKNLFTALTCISKNGKYIEKNLISGAVTSNTDKASANSSTAMSEQSQKTQSASVVSKVSLVSSASPMENAPPAAVHSPLRLTALGSSPQAAAGIVIVSTAQTNQPLFAIPLMSTGVGAVPVARTVVAFSSSLFDTSSLVATPHMTVAPQSSPVFQNAAASSFLSPIPQPAHINSSNSQPSKQQSPLQLQARPNERVHAPGKHLPVLNVPTIKPRASSQATKSVTAARKTDDHSLADKVPKSTISTSSSIASLLATSTSQAGMRSSSSSCLDNLPDDEPNPDAFKIFNLRPSSAHASSRASPTVSPGVPSVFSSSSPITSAYLQGPIAGFPPGMIIPPNFLPLSFSPQHQPLMQGMLAQKHGQRSSPLSRHPRLPYPSPGAMSAQSPPTVRSIITHHEPTTAAAVYLKKQQQQRELYLLKKQHQLIRQNQQQAVPRAHPAHQQPPSLSGQVYQPQPLPLSFDQRSLPGHSDFSQSSLYLSPVLVSSTSTAPSSSAPLTVAHSSSPSRPSKGVHKRSSSLYQCPYCPVLVTLKALDVASHIQQNHPGKQVAFRKIA